MCTTYFVDIGTFFGDMPPPPPDADAEMGEAQEGEALDPHMQMGNVGIWDRRAGLIFRMDY